MPRFRMFTSIVNCYLSSNLNEAWYQKQAIIIKPMASAVKRSRDAQCNPNHRPGSLMWGLSTLF
jgi:hypothetical protein